MSCLAFIASSRCSKAAERPVYDACRVARTASAFTECKSELGGRSCFECIKGSEPTLCRAVYLVTNLSWSHPATCNRSLLRPPISMPLYSSSPHETSA